MNNSQPQTVPAAHKSLFLFLLMLVCIVPFRIYADSLSVTVTPPLFQLTIGPGESWASTLKIVNNNSYDVSYYPQVVDMQASGEDGRSKFIPIVQESQDPALQTYALARWIRISSDPVVVGAGSSEEVPFSVIIPQNAEPGGHYAAILIGTQPGGLHATGTLLKVSSYVSSLLFVRIKGDVVENGRIREFITSQDLYQTPRADFLLRFENTGNTHVRPQGDVTIYNMWGKQRGQVLINQDTDFGNVLPNSIRRFQFSWTGENNPFDIGLYSAVVTLSYGEEGKHNTTAKTYFWVVPVVPVVVTIGTIALFILLMVWFLRRYIRRALQLEQRKLGLDSRQPPISQASLAESLLQPIKEGVIDLRSIGAKNRERAQGVRETITAPQFLPTGNLRQFLRKYRLFMLFLVVVLASCVGLWLYFGKVLVGTRGFQITDVHIEEEVSSTTLQQQK